MKQDPLNAMLQHWADRHAAKRVNLQSLEARIRAELEDERPRLPDALLPHRRTSLRSSFFWFVAGAAALALLQALIPWTAVVPERRSDPARLIRHDGDRKSTTMALFGEAAEMFPRRLRWVAETDEKVHVELAPRETLPLPASPLVQVRFVALLSGRDGSWKREWTATVITDGEDLISLPLPGGGSVELWAAQIDRGLIQADTRMVLISPAATASVSKILLPGVPELCISLGTADGELRVYQIVSPVTTSAVKPQA